MDSHQFVNNNSSGEVNDHQDASDPMDIVKEQENELDEPNLKPRTNVYSLESTESAGCLHEVVIPIDANYVELRDKTLHPGHKPARTYPFNLDPFQKRSIMCIENSQSVLVSAHTSAGKTVVAEYAIALSLRDKQRVIYTTPIKALSNQKYREFVEAFEDVGLITGDVTINPSASCLIMTTEILRQMLFRGNEIMREVGWVIFDEIHYMRDKERGVVWEETIILLPDNVRYVFLSATIPNARQFAEWIAHLHSQTCHVVYTDYRPVPLQHYIYPSGGDGLYLVVDEDGNLRHTKFNEAMSVLKPAENQQNQRRSFKETKETTALNLSKVVRAIMERNLAPVIIFSFSKKECEAYALQMNKLDLNTEEEKGLVTEVFTNAIDVLSDDDKRLPQVQQVLPLLKNGIGIHHGGLLPIIKEVIELLFGEGLIKALFATETFAMGLNMPAKTVVFSSARKFDGKDFRWITSGEYIQMSGRAGRRGLDDKGIVVLMLDEKITPAVGKSLIKGSPDHLNSAFHLTYNMVLNLLRVDGVNPEYMLQHSFFQFQNYASVPELENSIRRMEKQRSSIVIQDEKRCCNYFRIKNQIDKLNGEFVKYIQDPRYIKPFLNEGRLLKIVSNQGIDLDWCIFVDSKREARRRRNPREEEQFTYTIKVIAWLDESIEDPTCLELKSPETKATGQWKIAQIGLENITRVSSVCLKLPINLSRAENRNSVGQTIAAVKKQFDTVPLLDPIEDMKIKCEEFKTLVGKIDTYERELAECGQIDSRLLELYQEKDAIGRQIQRTQAMLHKAHSLLQMDELKCMKLVLRQLGYCSSQDVIEIKGRVACEITSGDELLLTEMLFNGAFNDLNVYQINALLSCFVFDEKTDSAAKLTEELDGPLRTMHELARRIVSVSKEAGLEIEEQTYIEKFRPNLMDVVYAWSKGSTFAQLCKMTDAFEGSIIRCMRRLEELLRQMCQASKVIGNTDLEGKFNEAITYIKRDIVFAAKMSNQHPATTVDETPADKQARARQNEETNKSQASPAHQQQQPQRGAANDGELETRYRASTDSWCVSFHGLVLVVPLVFQKFQDARLERAYQRYSHGQRHKSLVISHSVDLLLKIGLLFIVAQANDDYTTSLNGGSSSSSISGDVGPFNIIRWPPWCALLALSPWLACNVITIACVCVCRASLINVWLSRLALVTWLAMNAQTYAIYATNSVSQLMASLSSSSQHPSYASVHHNTLEQSAMSTSTTTAATTATSTQLLDWPKSTHIVTGANNCWLATQNMTHINMISVIGQPARQLYVWHVVLIIFMTYSMMPMALVWCFTCSLLTSVLDVLVTCFLADSTREVLVKVLVYTCVNVVSLYTKYLIDLAQRNAFLETRKSIETRSKIQRENGKQERLLLSLLPRFVALEIIADIASEDNHNKIFAPHQFHKIYIHSYKNVRKYLQQTW
ncbi:Exosome RNA helicase MTR4, partial [Fragariocoptes setiger]